MPKKKKPAQLEREIAEALPERDGWTKPRVREGWPETWEKLIDGWWYTIEKQPNGRWAIGFSQRRGDADSIDRGGTFATWEAVTAFAPQHRGSKGFF